MKKLLLLSIALLSHTFAMQDDPTGLPLPDQSLFPHHDHENNGPEIINFDPQKADLDQNITEQIDAIKQYGLSNDRMHRLLLLQQQAQVNGYQEMVIRIKNYFAFLTNETRRAERVCQSLPTPRQLHQQSLGTARLHIPYSPNTVEQSVRRRREMEELDSPTRQHLQPVPSQSRLARAPRKCLFPD